jgi:hypothetical protein
MEDRFHGIPEGELRPYDWCAWCLKGIHRDADHIILPTPLATPPAPGERAAVMRIERRPILFMIPPPGVLPEGTLPDGTDAFAVLCSEACRTALAEGAVRTVEDQLRHACAWCRGALGATIHAILAQLPGDGADRVGREGRLIWVTVGGRAVPGWVPLPSSNAALHRMHAGFKLCAAACAAALERAMNDENRLTVVH